MGRKTVLLDDLDGSVLPDDTEPVTFSLGRTTYSLYLTEDNHGKFMDALTPFIENAETTSSTPTASGGRSRRSSTTSGSADKEKMKAIRAWAQSTGFTFPSATEKDKDGKPVMKTLGDRGRIPEEVVKAYDEANN